MSFISAATAIIDLDALCSNYRLLADKAAPAEASAVVKANAYGLGATMVAKTLAEREGCRWFFVATIAEGIEVRSVLPDAHIGVFYGANHAEDAAAIAEHGLIPVLNSLEQVSVWREHAATLGKSHKAIVQVDTGMTRAGMSLEDAAQLAQDASLLAGIEVAYFMSHLACAEMLHHPLNAKQAARFKQLEALFPNAKFSFSNSSGIFLGKGFHKDLVRPGMALYGLNPTPDERNPMRVVVTVQAPVLQQRILTEDECVGYGATFKASKGARLAVVGIGYADGLLRSLSNRGKAYINGYTVPIAGIVSMDLTVLDVSSVPEGVIKDGDMAELIGTHLEADKVAETAGTIGYELFTSITSRVKRVYK
ncbi:MAG: alanine racemase [Alphaproteobacteria bacterium]|nr:alanine racemase [Alphaproteobacteria bacterium]